MSDKRAPAVGALFALRGWLGRCQILGAALLVAWALTGATTATAHCAAGHIDRLTRVTYVFDGDTVEIDGHERVRFIGINTPEIAHDGRPAQPMAERAKAELRALLRRHHERIGLRYGRERHDRYHRLLAHLYLRDGTSIEEWLLERGLATTLAIPPDVRSIGCYRAAERRARRAHRGIWALPAYQPLDSTHLHGRINGYRLIRGRVVHVGWTHRSVWLDLAGGVGLRIDRRDLSYFRSLDLRHIKDRVVLARGWVHSYHGEPRMRIRHPAALEIVH